MDSFGSRPLPRASRGIVKVLHAHLMRQPLSLACGLALASSILLSACTAPRVTMGWPTPTQSLDRLVPETSTASEVRSVLGRPRGTGLTRHTPEDPLRRIWVYEYSQVKGDQVGLDVLLVYLQDERYEGHMWFTTRELLKRGLPQ